MFAEQIQVYPINREQAGPAERVRLLACRVIADYPTKEYHHQRTVVVFTFSFNRRRNKEIQYFQMNSQMKVWKREIFHPFTWKSITNHSQKVQSKSAGRSFCISINCNNKISRRCFGVFVTTLGKLQNSIEYEGANLTKQLESKHISHILRCDIFAPYP